MRALLSLWMFLAPHAAAAPRGEGGPRPVLLIRVPAESGWQDLACLAAVPAMTVATDGTPAVIALGEAGEVPPEVADYLRRYRPTASYVLGSPVSGPHRRLLADSADAAAIVLARTFWKTSARAVVCRDDDYGAALVASALAGRLRAPLIFTGAKGLSAGALGELKRLKVTRAVAVGQAAAPARALKARGVRVAELADARAVLAWMRKEKLPVDYIAAVNPTDRSRTVVRKLSLAGPLLAAARGGMVVPLARDVRWKVGFLGADCGKARPKGVPKSKAPPRKGVISIEGKRIGFVVTSEPKDRRCRLRLDRNGNGAYDDPGEGPFAMGDVVALAGRDCAVSLGRKNGTGQADVRLTWPTAEQFHRDLRAHYDAFGRCPELLCLVGFPDTIPQAIVPNGPSSSTDLTSDLIYANVDGDRFAEIGVSRLVSESVTAATLAASRAVTYHKLGDGPWRRSLGEARWENTYRKLFENVGFDRSYRHDRDDLKWLVKPSKAVKGKRAREFDANSPLTRVAAIAHMAHSWWKDLGQTYTMDSTILLAPVLVESGGCLTATMDRQADFRSVIARLLRNGAVGFVGNARPGIAQQEQLRVEFWNAVLAGRTIGRAHRMALNSQVVTVLEAGQRDQGGDRYELYIRTLFGDPAVAMRVPSAPRSAPARVTVRGDVVSVHPPAAWWPVKIRVPEDWKKWADKDLYVCRGAGTYPLRKWCSQGYDLEVTCYTAELRTARRVKAIRQVQSPPKPLGWSGKYFLDEHADGTRSYRWRVQLIDFDQIRGKVLHKVDRLDYRVSWADAPA